MYFECVWLLYCRFFDCVLVLFVIKYFTKYTLCCRTQLTTLSHLLAVGGVTPDLYLARRNFVNMFDAGKTRMIGLPYGLTKTKIIVAKWPRDASCLYSFYTLEWCGYPMVKKIPSYHYSFWHDPRTWKKNRRFHVPQPTFLFPLETPLRLSRNMLHGWKDNSMLAKALAVCTYLSSTVSQLNDA